MKKPIPTTLLLLLALFLPPCAGAQDTGRVEDSVRIQSTMQEHPAPSLNIGIFLQHGYRTSRCDEDQLTILALGVMMKADIYTFPNREQSVFLRLSGSAGFISTFEAGAGIFLTGTFNLSVAYAYQGSPQCDRHNFSPSKTDNANHGALFALGFGRQGFLVELNGYFFTEEVYDVRTIDGGYARDVKWPIAYALRVGYAF